MKTTITEELSLANIERIIKEEVSGKELWGDIDISEAECDSIKARILLFLDNPKIDISYICKRFPVSLTTFMVFLVRYKFQNNFWGLFSQELGIQLNGILESEIGSCARYTFEKYGFDFSDVKGERRVNLEPILYEAGRPPESCLDDLFYVLKYDTYSVFDPHLIIDDLIDSRSYQIRKPMLRFLERFKDERAVEFVLEVHDTINIVDKGMDGFSRYADTYIEWKEKEHSKERTSNRKKKEFQTKPYLVFDNGKRGLCMVLPRTILSDEWVEDVEWIIRDNDGIEVCKKMFVMGDDGSRFTESIMVPVSAAQRYTVTLYDNENIENSKLIEWDINGIKKGDILYFNSNGHLVKPGFLLYPYGNMVFDQSVSIIDTQNVNLLYQHYPTDKGKYTNIIVEPTSNNAFVTYQANGEKTLRDRPQINLNLEGDTLFGLWSEKSNSIYTHIPLLKISLDEGLLTNGLTLRFGKQTLDLNSFINDGTIEIDLKQYAAEFSKYGIYEIRVYQYDRFLKQVEFCYVPDIGTDYSPHLKWPDHYEGRARKQYRFKKLPNWQLQFEDCVMFSNEDNYTIECPPGIGVIHGVLKKDGLDDGFSCHFELPVRPFELEIYDDKGLILANRTNHIERISLEDIDNREYWVSLQCFGEYRKRHYSVILRTANGIEQTEDVLLSQNGCGNINLATFYDTLRNCPPPARFELWCDNDDKLIYSFLVVSDTPEMKKRPRYFKNGFIVLGLEDDGKDLIVKRFGSGEELKLLYENSVLGKSKKTRGYRCPTLLQEGIYTVDGDINKSDLFMDESGSQITNGNNTMAVSYRGKSINISSIADWLDQLTRDIIDAGMNDDIKGKVSFACIQNLHNYDRTLDIYEYERLVAISYFINSKCINAKKNSLRQCMRAISALVLNRTSRLEIIRLLSQLNCEREIFDTCLQEYNLFLFEPGSSDAKYLAEKVEKHSPELSMMLLMGCNDSIRNALWKDCYREIVGKEAIKCLLSVPAEADAKTVVNEQRKFLKEERPCKIRINLTNEIAGDMEPIQKMIEVTYKSIIFNKSKKPDFGIYFDRIRYVDQYVNWYSLSHDKDGKMLPWKKNMMIDVVQEDCYYIVRTMNELKRTPGVSRIARRYDDVLRSRFSGDPFANMNANQYPRYFYLQGIAALLALLPKEYRPRSLKFRASEHFMAHALTIAPRIARRDMLMAATFIYLMRKEEQLCR